MSIDGLFEDQYVKVRDLQRISLDKDDVLLIKVGIDGMKQEDVDKVVRNIAHVFRENLPSTKMIVTTVSAERPFDVYAINKAFIIEEKDDGSERDSGKVAEHVEQP